ITVTGGGVVLLADSLDVQQGIKAGSNLLAIAPLTSGRALSLGSKLSDRLSLTDGGLARMTASAVRLGNSSSGAIAVHSRNPRHSGYNTLSLTTAGQVTQVAPLSAVNLCVQSLGAVFLNDSGNDVDTLAAQVTGGGNGLSYTDANLLTIGTVDGVNGMTTNAGS